MPMSWPWKPIPLCFGGGEGKERLSAAVFLETKRNVASSIHLDSHDDEVYMLLFVARISVSHLFSNLDSSIICAEVLRRFRSTELDTVLCLPCGGPVWSGDRLFDELSKSYLECA